MKQLHPGFQVLPSLYQNIAASAKIAIKLVANPHLTKQWDLWICSNVSSQWLWNSLSPAGVYGVHEQLLLCQQHFWGYKEDEMEETLGAIPTKEQSTIGSILVFIWSAYSPVVVLSLIDSSGKVTLLEEWHSLPYLFFPQHLTPM